MSQTFLINGKDPIPSFLAWLIASWAISLAAFTAMGLIVWMVWGEPDHNLLDALPVSVSILFGIWGVYTGIGALLLSIAMWIYWARYERSSRGVRARWFLALLLGMYYGALIYEFYIWRKGVIKNVTASPAMKSAQ